MQYIYLIFRISRAEKLCPIGSNDLISFWLYQNTYFWFVFIPLSFFWPVITWFMHFSSIYQSNLNIDFILSNLHRVREVTALFIREVFYLKAYGLWLIIFFGSLMLGIKGRNGVIGLWVLLYLFFLAISYFFTPLPLDSHWVTSFYRIITAMLPIIIANSFIMILCDLRKNF